MKHKKLKLSTLLLVIGFIGLQAQDAITTTGDNASGSGGSAGYTVGQVVYTTTSGTTGSVAQGVQQPYEISVVTSIEEAKGINLTVSAYPNPTTDFLQLKVEGSTSLSVQTMSIQLFDLSRKLLQAKNLSGTETQIDMSNLFPATYFVKVIQENKEIKTFKIIKY